jgi:AcrR family transcriptional regulator
MPRVSRAQFRAEITHKIVEAAMLAFERDGFDKTSVATIAEKANVSERTIYRHFPNKADLVYQSLLPNINAIPRGVKALRDDLPIDVAVRQGIAGAIELQEGNRTQISRHLKLASSSPQLISYGKALTEAAIQDLRNELSRRIGSDAQPEEVVIWAELSFLLVFGAVTEWLFEPTRPLMPIVLRCAMAVSKFSDMINLRSENSLDAAWQQVEPIPRVSRRSKG